MESNNINKRERKTSVSSRRILIVVVALLLLCVAIVIFLKYPPKSGMAKPSSVQAAAPDVINTPAEQPPQVSAAQPPAAAQPVAENADASEKPQNPSPAKKDPKPKDEKVVQDPLSRVALSLVGVDPEAEDYWLGAVFDPSLPKSERQDLVDDLNEEGLPDPKHPTEDDLPVLFRRLEMLEALVPYLDGNLEWDESREDILNLIDLAMGDGHPVN